MGATGAGAIGAGVTTAGGAGEVIIGGAMPCAIGWPGVTTMPDVVAGGATVVRMNGFVVGCELRQLTNVAAVRRTAQGRFIRNTPCDARAPAHRMR
jgi:hypothetical protein